jgi:hypothetical protein
MTDDTPRRATPSPIKQDTQEDFLSDADLDRFLPAEAEEDDENQDDDEVNFIRQDEVLAPTPRFTFQDLVKFLKGNIAEAKLALKFGNQAVKAGATVPVKVLPRIAHTKGPEISGAKARATSKEREM